MICRTDLGGKRSVMPEFTGLEPFTTWDGAFTAQELDTIVAYGDALRQAEATVMDPADNSQTDSIRNTRISWIEQSQETQWLFQRLRVAASSTNQPPYGDDL